MIWLQSRSGNALFKCTVFFGVNGLNILKVPLQTHLKVHTNTLLGLMLYRTWVPTLNNELEAHLLFFPHLEILNLWMTDLWPRPPSHLVLVRPLREQLASRRLPTEETRQSLSRKNYKFEPRWVKISDEQNAKCSAHVVCQLVGV